MPSYTLGLRHCLFLFGFAALAHGQSGAPGTDIFLAGIRIDRGRIGRISLETPVNFTNRPGYDNQPSFTPDGRAILFTSIRDGKQADTYRYTLKTG
jgi:Tol biopolymer transport system component